VVEGVVQATAFRPLKAAGDDQFRNGGYVAQLKEIRGDDEVPVVLPDFLLKVAQALLGTP